MRKLKVAIVHDWLVGGGAERVVMELHKMYPDAPIFTSYCSDEWRKRLDGKVVTGWLQHFGRLRKIMVLGRIWWFSRLDFSGYDVVISSSGNGEAFGIRVPKGTTHICYCHTPTHYYWRQYRGYLNNPGFGMFNPLARMGLRLLVGPLRRWDYQAAQRVDFFIANSSHIQADIKEFYGRDAVVIYPPVDVGRFTPAPANERKGFVSVSRLVPAKRIDLLVQAATKLDLSLTVISSGPELNRLKQMAGPTVTFTGKVSDAEVARYLAHAEGYLFASYDDFGIVPVEAMAAGTPVIAYKAGGALDYVVPGKTGIFFAEQTVNSLAGALKDFNPKQFDNNAIRVHALKFAPEVFVNKIQTFIEQSVAKGS